MEVHWSAGILWSIKSLFRAETGSERPENPLRGGDSRAAGENRSLPDTFRRAASEF